MSTPTDPVRSGYMADIQDALEEIYDERTQTADLLRDWLYEALADVVTGQMSTATDTTIGIARDINRGRWAA